MYCSITNIKSTSEYLYYIDPYIKQDSSFIIVFFFLGSDYKNIKDAKTNIKLESPNRIS